MKPSKMHIYPSETTLWFTFMLFGHTIFISQLSEFKMAMNFFLSSQKLAYVLGTSKVWPQVWAIGLLCRPSLLVNDIVNLSAT